MNSITSDRLKKKKVFDHRLIVGVVAFCWSQKKKRDRLRDALESIDRGEERGLH